MNSVNKIMVAFRFKPSTSKLLKRFAKARNATQTAVLESLVDRHCKTSKKMKHTKIHIAIIAALLPFTASAVEINGQLIHAVAMVESNNNHRAVGDQGKANGAFQMWKPAWADCSAWLKRNGFKTTSYKEGVNDPNISHQYCKVYLSLLHSQLRRKLDRDPTAADLYCAYNLGLRGFERRGFKLGNTPETTQAAVNKLYRLLK